MLLEHSHLESYAPLEKFKLGDDARVSLATLAPPPRVTLDSPAHLVMTDFTVTPAACVEPGVSVAITQDYMRRRGVRALLVMTGIDAEFVQGIITSTDLWGEKASRAMRMSGSRRENLPISQLMTPRGQLELIEYEELFAMRVGHVVATMRDARRHHLLVGEPGPRGERIRGMFSLNQVARQLGGEISPPPLERSFDQAIAELEASLSLSQ